MLFTFLIIGKKPKLLKTGKGTSFAKTKKAEISTVFKSIKNSKYYFVSCKGAALAETFSLTTRNLLKKASFRKIQLLFGLMNYHP